MWNLAICHLEEIPDSEIVNWYVAGDDSLCSSVPNRYEEVDSIYLLYVQEPVPQFVITIVHIQWIYISVCR